MQLCGLKTTFRDLWACCFSLKLRGSLRWNFKLGSNFVTPHWVHDIIKGTFQRPKACLCQSSSNLKRRLNDSTKKAPKPFWNMKFANQFLWGGGKNWNSFDYDVSGGSKFLTKTWYYCILLLYCGINRSCNCLNSCHQSVLRTYLYCFWLITPVLSQG